MDRARERGDSAYFTDGYEPHGDAFARESETRRDGARFERRGKDFERATVTTVRDATTTAATTERRFSARGVNFPASRTILWDDEGAGEDEDDGTATASSSGCAPRVRVRGDASEAIARAVARVSGGEEETRAFEIVRSRGRIEPGTMALVGRSGDARRTTVEVTASSEEDAEHYAALDDGCVEFTARLVPEDPNGDEYSVASTLHGTAWTNEDDMRMEFYEACERDSTLFPANYCPMRAVATTMESGGARALRVVFAVNMPSCDFELRPIHPLRVATNETSVDALAAAASGEDGVSTGFVTLDRTRRVVFLAESARGTDDEPLTGVWMQGIDRADGPATWAACLRFACSDRLSKLTQRGKFLFVSLFAGASSPAFYEVTATHSSAPFVPFGVDMIVRPGETAEAQATPLDAGVVPAYFKVTPEEYGAEHYGFEYGEGFVSSDSRAYDDEVHPAEEEEEVEDEEQFDADEDDEENRERNARMEALQREIDFIRDKIASISQEDYEYDEKENVERFDDEDDVIRRRLDDDELPSRRAVVDDDDVSDAVRRLTDELNADIQRSKFGASDSNVETDPKARGYVRVPSDDVDAAAHEAAIRETDEEISRLLAANALGGEFIRSRVDGPTPFSADEVEEDHFPRIKYDASLADQDDADQDDADADAIISKYLPSLDRAALADDDEP